MRRWSIAVLALVAACGTEPGFGGGDEVLAMPGTGARVTSIQLAGVSAIADNCLSGPVPSPAPVAVSVAQPQAALRAYVYWSYTNGDPAVYRDCDAVAVDFTLDPLVGVEMGLIVTGPQTAALQRLGDGSGTATVVAEVGSQAAEMSVQQTN